MVIILKDFVGLRQDALINQLNNLLITIPGDCPQISVILFSLKDALLGVKKIHLDSLPLLAGNVKISRRLW